MRCLILCLCCLTNGTAAITQTLTGNILDQATNQPIVFAHIGVVGTQYGTISDEQGDYSIHIFDSWSDSIQVMFSAVGYQSQILSLAQLRRQPDVLMTPTSVRLSEVIVKDRQRSQYRTIGKHAENRRFVTGWSRAVSSGGVRVARLKLPNKTLDAQLMTARFHLAINGFDSLLFRLHFYDWDEEAKSPADAWELPTDIFVTQDHTTGWVTFDLREFNLIAASDFCMGVEVVKAYGNCQADHCLNFSVAFLAGKIYWRNSITGTWEASGLGSPAFEVDIRY